MTLPTINLTGNLVDEPELRFTNEGKAVANFRVACNDSYKNQAGEWVDNGATFLSVSVWGPKGEAAVEILHKGSKVMLVGQLKQREYEKDGEKRTAYEVRAFDVAELVAPVKHQEFVPQQTQAPF
jgi:single-strand DNA-binding protein